METSRVKDTAIRTVRVLLHLGLDREHDAARLHRQLHAGGGLAHGPHLVDVALLQAV